MKPDVYERTGVDEYWIVDPTSDTVEVHRRAGERFSDPIRLERTSSLTTPLMLGMALPLDKLFA